jgi:hypothetical protein
MGFFTSSFSFVAKAGALLTRPLVTGDGNTGMNIRVKKPFTGVAYGMCFDFRGANKLATVNPDTGLKTASSPLPVNQVETATVLGTITAAGSVLVTLTSNLLPGFPPLVIEGFASGSSAPVVAAEIAVRLQASSLVTAHYDIILSGSTVALRVLVATDNDATLNLAIANDTATGLTAAPTSENTTAGVGGVITTGGDGKDLEGAPIVTGWSPYLLALRNTGAGIVEITTNSALTGVGAGKLRINPYSCVILAGETIDFRWQELLTITAVTSTTFELLYYGGD